MRKMILALALSLISASGAFAQSSVQQSAARLDAATFLQGPAGTTTSCSTINTTAANNTVTITPPGSQYVVITGVFVDIVSNATGVASLAYLSTTNLTGSPAWSLGTNLVGSNVGPTYRQIAETFPTGLRSTTPGTAVTFVPSAQNAQSVYCVRVAGYFSY